MIDLKEWNKEFYAQHSPTPVEIAHQDKLVRKALQLITQGSDYFEEARDTLLEAGKVKHWDERIYNFEHGVRVPLVFWYRHIDYWENEAPAERRERFRKIAERSTNNIIKRAKEELLKNKL